MNNVYNNASYSQAFQAEFKNISNQMLSFYNVQVSNLVAVVFLPVVKF
jgi:hypothetical protein